MPSSTSCGVMVQCRRRSTPGLSMSSDVASPSVTLLTGGGDRPYVIGLATSLVAQGVTLDLIGSDFLDVPELRSSSRIRFLNLRGDMSLDAPLASKVARVARYYVRLVHYALFST